MICLEAETWVQGTAQPRIRRGMCGLHWRGSRWGWSLWNDGELAVPCEMHLSSNPTHPWQSYWPHKVLGGYGIPAGSNEKSAPKVCPSLRQKRRQPWGSKPEGVLRNFRAGSALSQSMKLVGAGIQFSWISNGLEGPSAMRLTLVVVVGWRCLIAKIVSTST